MSERCYWCGKPSTDTREVEPARERRDGTLERRAIVARVCRDHAAMVDRNVRERELRRLIPRRRGQLARTQAESKRAALEVEIARLEDELAALTAVAA